AQGLAKIVPLGLISLALSSMRTNFLYRRKKQNRTTVNPFHCSETVESGSRTRRMERCIHSQSREVQVSSTVSLPLSSLAYPIAAPECHGEKGRWQLFCDLNCSW